MAKRKKTDKDPQRKETVMFGTPRLSQEPDEPMEEGASSIDAREAHLPDEPPEPPEPPAAPEPPAPAPTTRQGTVLMDAPAEEAKELDDEDDDDDDDEPPDESRDQPHSHDIQHRGPRPGAPPISLRKSLMLARQKNRTTIAELSDLADRLTIHAEKRLPIGRKIAIATAISIAVVMLVATALATGGWRWLLWGFAFVAIGALLTWGSVRLLKRYARRAGTRVLPGGPLIWLGSLFGALVVFAVILTYSLSKATTRLASAAFPEWVPDAPDEPEAPREIDLDALSDNDMKRTDRISVGGGILHVPDNFLSEDGSYDLLVHFHGNTELVIESASHAGLNALVHVVNVGNGSGPYEDRYAVPAYFPEALRRIQEKVEGLGLKNPHLRRLALSSWSAGYGAVAYILRNEKVADQVDALLLMDSLHAGFVDRNTGEIDPLKLAPFIDYAKQAAAGDKLMVVTHSGIQTLEYASTTQTADALLAALGIERAPLKDLPARVDFDVAMHASPASTRRWLEEGCTEAHKGKFHLIGCKGRIPEDHIAHLVQMSTTVLPPLVERWK